MADLVTPNLPEASALIGGENVVNISDMREAAQAIHALGPRQTPFLIQCSKDLHILEFQTYGNCHSHLRTACILCRVRIDPQESHIVVLLQNFF